MRKITKKDNILIKTNLNETYMPSRKSETGYVV